MHKSMFLVPVLAALLMMSGCGDPAIDASSEETFKKSVEEIQATLDEKKKEQFTQAIATLMMKKVMFAPGVFGDEAAAKKKMKEVFDGKTADEIIEAGGKEQAATKEEMEKMFK